MGVVDKVRSINRALFTYSPVPSDYEKFIKELEIIDDTGWDYVKRSIEAYKIKERYSDLPTVYKYLKYLIHGLVYILLYLYSCFVKTPQRRESVDTVYYKISENESIIPQRVLKKTGLVQRKMSTTLYLDDTAKKLLKECSRISRGNLPFLFGVLYSLGNYSYIVNKYNPKEIITTYESLATVSVLTQYCRLKGVKHINYMHGEKILSPVNVLGQFDEMYVWDEYYIELFKLLKYSCDTYKVCNPWINEKLPEPDLNIDYIFYLNYETDKDLKKIKEEANLLISKGKTVRVRPHPSQYDRIKKKHLFSTEILEDHKKVPILQSIANGSNAISRYSTVLFQAYIYGKNVIIDDCTNSLEYERLKFCRYIMLAKKHKLLSEEVNKL